MGLLPGNTKKLRSKEGFPGFGKGTNGNHHKATADAPFGVGWRPNKSFLIKTLGGGADFPGIFGGVEAHFGDGFLAHGGEFNYK